MSEVNFPKRSQNAKSTSTIKQIPPHQEDSWRMVRYLIEKAHADYTYRRLDGVSFSSIIKGIRQKAIEEKATMPADFDLVMKIVENDPVQAKQHGARKTSLKTLSVTGKEWSLSFVEKS